MLKVKPLAFDSLGVRSMATFVETTDLKILIDPGVALGPMRYKLPPHNIEVERCKKLWDVVKEHASLADILIVTHYHYDHYNPEEPELYEGKVVYLKDPKTNINKSQKTRASHFLKELSELPKSIEVADGNSFKHGSTIINFSEPVFHGTDSKLGYVTEVSISCGNEKVLHTSDVEGASQRDQIDFVLEEKPDILILDGPMTYMLGYSFSKDDLRRSLENLMRVIFYTDVKSIVIDHHFMRDLKYEKKIEQIYEIAEERNVKVVTAAEFAGDETEMLEARRRELYKE
ncbi:MAG: MBL fold metallo-hydrolase [Halobacteriota archaeon]|nr:MBL fold metallo-hydrolase [Halobacteriota archaeon]